MDELDDYENSDRTILRRAATDVTWDDSTEPELGDSRSEAERHDVFGGCRGGEAPLTLSEPGDTYPDDAPTWPNYAPVSVKPKGDPDEEESTARLKLYLAGVRA